MKDLILNQNPVCDGVITLKEITDIIDVRHDKAMTKEQLEKIIIHQVNLELKEKGLSEKDLTHFEYLKLKYEVALKLLCELS